MKIPKRKCKFDEWLYNMGVDKLHFRDCILNGLYLNCKKRTKGQDKYWAESQEISVYVLFETHRSVLNKLPWDYRKLYKQFKFFKPKIKRLATAEENK